MKKPDIFHYMDLRLFLKDLYLYRKSAEKSFSYEKWAEELGFRSRSYLRALVAGDKPLHESILEPLYKSLGLDEKRSDYLTLLLRYSTAPSDGLRESYGRQLIAQWRSLLHQIQVQDISEFLADPIIPVLFTYLSFQDATSDIVLLSKFLQCDPGRIASAMRCLVWQKLVDGTVQADGQISYKTTAPYFQIPSVPGNDALRNFHREGLRLATEALERPSTERKCYAAFVAMNEEQFGKFQELIQDFNQRLLSICDSSELGEKKIYRFNAQIFPASQ